MADLPPGTLFEGRWRLGRKIGEGACAKVYEVTPVNPAHADFPLVAKVIQLPKAGSKSAKDKEQRRLCDTLYHEYNVCVNNFHDLECIPRRPLRFYGEADGYRYLVMEKLESDLSDVAKRGETTASQAGRLGLQILDGLKHIHQKGFFFIDIKPDNFMMKGDRLFFVDFGLAEKRPNPTAGLYGGPDAGRTFAGTATYASIDALSGKMPSAADEIIAMVYVLLAVLNGGKLPWTGAKSDADIIRMKQTVDMHEFAGDLQAEELFTILDEVQRDGVNYDRIASHLQRLSNKNVGKASTSAKGRTVTQKAASSEPAGNSSPLKGARPNSSRSQKAPPTVEEEPVVQKPKASKRKATTEPLPSPKEVEPEVERPRSSRITSAAAKAAAIAAKSVPIVILSNDDEVDDAPVAKKRGRTVVRKDVVDLSSPFTADDDQSEDVPSTRKRSRAATAASKKETAPAPVPTPVPAPVPAPAPKGAQSRAAKVQAERPISPIKAAPSSKATASRASSSRGKSRSPVTAAPDIEVDPDDILGYEDGIPSYLNACYEDTTAKSAKSAASAAASGPFSLRKSEYHRHRLSSFGGNESIGSPSPVKTTRKGRK